MQHDTDIFNNHLFTNLEWWPTAHKNPPFGIPVLGLFRTKDQNGLYFCVTSLHLNAFGDVWWSDKYHRGAPIEWAEIFPFARSIWEDYDARVVSGEILED